MTFFPVRFVKHCMLSLSLVSACPQLTMMIWLLGPSFFLLDNIGLHLSHVLTINVHYSTAPQLALCPLMTKSPIVQHLLLW